MIKTLINPRYSAFDQTAGTIGQLLVHSDIQAGTIGQHQVTHMGIESVDVRLIISCYSFILNKIQHFSINTVQGIVSAASLFLLPIQRTTAI